MRSQKARDGARGTCYQKHQLRRAVKHKGVYELNVDIDFVIHSEKELRGLCSKIGTRVMIIVGSPKMITKWLYRDLDMVTT